MKSPPTLPQTLHADPEHAGIRVVVLFLMLAALIASFYLLNGLFELFGGPDYGVLLSCAGSLPLALLLVWLAERGMKQVWHSGRKIELTQQGVSAIDKKAEPERFMWAANLSALNWYFALDSYQRGGRERRVPKDWHCLACQLTQGEKRLVVHTFLSPKATEQLLAAVPKNGRFHELDPTEVYDKPAMFNRAGPPVRPDIPSRILAGSEGRYWVAEKQRWQHGYELSPLDFETFITAVYAKIRKS